VTFIGTAAAVPAAEADEGVQARVEGGVLGAAREHEGEAGGVGGPVALNLRAQDARGGARRLGAGDGALEHRDAGAVTVGELEGHAAADDAAADDHHVVQGGRLHTVAASSTTPEQPS
jgi:hypothetical protein